MGQKKYNLGKLKFRDIEAELEINEGIIHGDNDHIHLQNEKYRIEFHEDEFDLFLSSIIHASTMLKKYKK